MTMSDTSIKPKRKDVCGDKKTKFIKQRITNLQAAFTKFNQHREENSRNSGEMRLMSSEQQISPMPSFQFPVKDLALFCTSRNRDNKRERRSHCNFSTNLHERKRNSQKGSSDVDPNKTSQLRGDIYKIASNLKPSPKRPLMKTSRPSQSDLRRPHLMNTPRIESRTPRVETR